MSKEISQSRFMRLKVSVTVSYPVFNKRQLQPDPCSLQTQHLRKLLVIWKVNRKWIQGGEDTFKPRLHHERIYLYP